MLGPLASEAERIPPKEYRGRAQQPGKRQGQRRNEEGCTGCPDSPGNLQLQLSTLYPSVSLLQKQCSVWSVPHVDTHLIFHIDLILIYFPILRHLNC